MVSLRECCEALGFDVRSVQRAAYHLHRSAALPGPAAANAEAKSKAQAWRSPEE
jgi:hypothetical protein